MAQGTFVAGATTITFDVVWSPHRIPDLTSVSRLQNTAGAAGSNYLALDEVAVPFALDVTIIGTWDDADDKAFEDIIAIKGTQGTLTLNGKSNAYCVIDSVEPPQEQKAGTKVKWQRMTLQMIRLK